MKIEHKRYGNIVWHRVLISMELNPKNQSTEKSKSTKTIKKEHMQMYTSLKKINDLRSYL